MRALNPSEIAELRTKRLNMKILDSTFAEKILEYYERNREYFSANMADTPENFYERRFHEENQWFEFELLTRGWGVRLFLFEIGDLKYERVVGDIFIFNILRGALQSCVMSYKIDNEFAGKGYASEAIEKVLDFVFGQMALRRVEINILAKNAPSLAIARKFGFAEEGVARGYMKIGGKPKDHLRFSLLAPDW